MGWHLTLLAALLPQLVSAGLSQNDTNGNSVFGTPKAPRLPAFLTNNPLPQGFPWGGLTANGTNAYTTHPTTGVVRAYDFTLSRGTLAPDGVPKAMILVNGQFPGPLIEANWGDTIEVTVRNNITAPEEGTALHWHGFLQQGSPWEDGVPAVSQCPIAPGGVFTYRFQATLYGTTWYHAHYSAQYGDGAVGPMVVYGPSQEPYDVDVGPILLSDWYHTDYLTLVERMLAPGGSPIVVADNNLIQGKNTYCNTNSSSCAVATAASDTADAAAGRAVFRFEPGKTHRLRLVNTGSEALQHFSIDNHTMTVVAYDFVPVVPYETTVVVLGVGQRADVLVTADAAVDAGESVPSFWMRSSTAACSFARQHEALAIVYYESANTTAALPTPTGGLPTEVPTMVPTPGMPTKRSVGAAGMSAGRPSGTKDARPLSYCSEGHCSVGDAAPWSVPASSSSSSSSSSSCESSTLVPSSAPVLARVRGLPTTQPWPQDARVCTNDDLQRTEPLFPIALPAASWTHTMDVRLEVNASNVTLWTFDGTSFRGDYNAPTLLLAALGNATAGWPAQWNGRAVGGGNSSVRLVVRNASPAPHPMHLHGSNVYVLHEGPGAWDGAAVVRPANPMRRDVQVVRPGGHVVLQFDATNPGVWPFHCHVAWHASGGFFAQFVVQAERLVRDYTVPGVVAQTCRDWAAWTGTHVPDQIDSGL